MLSLYFAALAFGGVLLGVSLVGGGHDDGGDADHGDADHGHEGGANHDTHALSTGGFLDAFWRTFLSLRFFTFGSFAFGLAGSLLTLIGVPAVLAAVASSVMGAGVGFGVARAFRHLTRDTVSGEVGIHRLVGQEARVLLRIHPEKPGKIVVQTMAGRVELLATTRDHDEIPVGASALIAHIEGGTAQVTAMPTLGTDAPRREATTD